MHLPVTLEDIWSLLYLYYLPAYLCLCKKKFKNTKEEGANTPLHNCTVHSVLP